MSTAGIVALRIAATLAHALPGLRLRIRDGERTLLDVTHPAHDRDGGPATGPCAFRQAVARAHEQLEAGAHLSFMDLPDDVEPAVDIGLRSGDQALPGGIYRVTVADRTIHAFATTLSPEQCREALSFQESEAVCLYHDAATEITLVHTVSEPGPPADAAQRLLENALGVLVTDELLHELAGTAR